MLANIRETFEKTLKKMSGRGRLAAADVEAAAREIKLALLAADVHYGVVKDFVDAIAARAVGADVLESITPHQQFTKIIHDELTRVLGQDPAPFDFACEPPLKVMMVGLQGSGKTTTAARFALRCRKLGRRPLLVPADVQRPAAVEQLTALARQAGVDCWPTEKGERAVKVVKAALKHAEKIGYDTVVIDTAGRLHVDDEMMDEISDISDKARPQRVLYVADAMTGQDAVRAARAFDERLPVTGVVLTKLDGDARGGAALSIRAVTGKPIIYIGTGERLADFDEFHPERMASRILGRGDIVALVDAVAASVEEKELAAQGNAFAKKRFTLEEFLTQLRMLKRMGPLEKVLGMMPGMDGLMKGADPQQMERDLKRREAIVLSMTRQERVNPDILNGSRRSRIARGSGVEVSEVNRFLKEFKAMEAMMKGFAKGRLGKAMLKGLTSRAFS